MSQTTNLGLFKHDNPATNTNAFDVKSALNDNWDKIDEEVGDIDNNITTIENNLNTEINNRQSITANLQNQINGLASGSPLVASSVSEMTDTTRVYVNTTDGHWYYYNGTEWTDGGVYQASEDSQSINKLKNDLIELRNDVLIEPSNQNLIDWDKCEKGQIMIGNGLYRENDIGWISNIMECEPSTTYVYSVISRNTSTQFNGVYFWDSLNTFINMETNISTFTTPPNAKYMQIEKRYQTASGTGASSGETKEDLSNDYYWNKTKLQKGSVPTLIEDTKLNSNVKIANINLDNDVSSDIAKGVYAYNNMSKSITWYKNKIMMTYGDSIVALGGWQPYVQEYFGIANGYNRGIGGTTVSNNGQKATLWNGTQIDGWMCCDERIAQMTPTNNDFLLILAGHNDWGFNVPIGEIGDTLVDSNFKSAYALMIKKIQVKFPTIPIICMTPINGRVHASGVNQDVQEKNSLGLTMTDYAEAVIDVCRHYSIPCIDLNTMTRINVLNASSYLQDVIHPNANGWKRLASAIIQGMKVFEPINDLIV